MSQNEESVNKKADLQNKSALYGTYKKQRGRQPNGEPNKIDIHVGKKLLQRRSMLKITQEIMAKKLGITYQQIQKYEKGANRIAASRLWDFAQVLGVSINYFFEDIDDDLAQQSPRFLQDGDVTGFEADRQGNLEDEAKHEIDVLIRAFYKLPTKKARLYILKVMEEIARQA